MKFLDRVDAVAKRLERFATGGSPQDPLYVTNRTFGQKARLALLVGAPLLAIAAFIGLAMNNYFDPPANPEKAAVKTEPTGEITGKILPHVEKDLAISSDYSRDIEVLEASVTHDANPSITGRLRNTTERTIGTVDLVLDVTDEEGSQLGGVAVRVENVPAHAVVPFRKALEQRNARSALVREVHSR